MADIPTRVVVTGGTTESAPATAPASGQQSFVRRILELSVTLSANQKTGQPIKFAGTDSDTVTLSGFRTRVRIGQYGAPAGNQASVQIYGLAPSLMNQLSSLGKIFNGIERNTVLVSAGDDQSGVSPVFGGTIVFAFGDYNSAPSVPFHLECQSGYINAVVPYAASSYPQPVDVATIMAGFANKMGKSFENNGVNVQLPPSYFPGTLWQQFRKVAQVAHINAELVDGDSKLAIWPMGGSRSSQNGQNIPILSKTTGMIGYPIFAPNGYMIVNSIFNPQISFGSNVRVESSLDGVNRTWTVQRIELLLDSMLPNGNWKMSMSLFPAGFANPPVPPVGG